MTFLIFRACDFLWRWCPENIFSRKSCASWYNFANVANVFSVHMGDEFCWDDYVNYSNLLLTIWSDTADDAISLLGKNLYLISGFVWGLVVWTALLYRLGCLHLSSWYTKKLSLGCIVGSCDNWNGQSQSGWGCQAALEIV